MTTITVRFRGNDYTARLADGEEWQVAAARAIRRAAGRSATVWGWTMDSREVDRDDNTISVTYKGTVVGKPSRGDRNSYPVLGEARISL